MDNVSLPLICVYNSILPLIPTVFFMSYCDIMLPRFSFSCDSLVPLPPPNSHNQIFCPILKAPITRHDFYEIEVEITRYIGEYIATVPDANISPSGRLIPVYQWGTRTWSYSNCASSPIHHYTFQSSRYLQTNTACPMACLR